MNKRDFIATLAKAALGFAVLPSATTYARSRWKGMVYNGIWRPNPDWVNAEYEISMAVDLRMYNQLPFYLAKTQIENQQIAVYKTWQRMATEASHLVQA